MLNLSEFIDDYSNRSGLSKAKSKQEITRFVENFKSATVEAGGVNINGFVKSVVVDVPAKKSRSPRTGDVIDVPAKRIVEVKAAPSFRNMEIRAVDDGE